MNAPFTRDLFVPSQRRMLALWFPYLATDRILRARLGRTWRSATAREAQARTPLAISRHDRNAQRVAAFCEKGAALGLKAGMGLADLRAMHPHVEIVEADPDADARLLCGLADWCDRYTPLVALGGEDGLFLDVTGCAHLFGGEQAMLDDAVRRLGEQGICARAGIAATPGMAWAAARYLKPVPLPAGVEADALSGLPLHALRLEAGVCSGLESVGLRTVGAVMAAPRAPLARRFGTSLLLRLDQALGVADEAVSPRMPVPPLSVERALPEPIVLREDVEHLVRVMAGTLKEDLERRGEGARALQLALFRVDGAVRRLGVSASRPLRDPPTILRLFRERLAGLDGMEADCGFELARLSVLQTAAMEEEQADLSGARDSDDTALALFADRVRARLGEAAILSPRLAESHVPECAVAMAPFPAAAPVPVPAEPARERPVRLLPAPEPVEVAMAEVPEGPPRQFRWRRATYRVMRAEGPERIAPEWWRGGREEDPTRDYFRIEDEEGRRYWLYRQGFYEQAAPAPRWFLQGIFA